LYELEQLDKPPFADSVWMGHVALVTPDIDRLVEFYTKLLGVKPHNRIDNIRNSPKLD
jgi:catechol-2,3-dioxygenase